MPIITAFDQEIIQEITFFHTDVNVVIQANLTITDLDPTGAVVKLEVDHGIGERNMVFNETTRQATYAVQDGEFLPGLYNAQVRVIKGAAIIHSQIFQIRVKKGITPPQPGP